MKRLGIGVGVVFGIVAVGVWSAHEGAAGSLVLAALLALTLAVLAAAVPPLRPAAGPFLAAALISWFVGFLLLALFFTLVFANMGP